MSAPDAKLFKNIILNTRTPQVIKHLSLDWKCFSHDLSEWARLFDSAPQHRNGVAFDCAPLRNGVTPQWESKRGTIQMTASTFVAKCAENDPQHWASFSYKQLIDLPAACRDGVSLEKLGFDGLEDYTFWLGSAGAHTPCHFDTYGCNVVVQVYGRKSWLLFPPSTKLDATRVPYEESSVYCSENFFSPSGDFDQFMDIEENAFHVILEPGDILVVPPRWWHYVESLDASLAINKWIPLECDLTAQIAECLVKINMCEFTRGLSEDLKRALINPNEFSTLYTTPLAEQLRLLSMLRRLHGDPDLCRKTFEREASNYLPVDVLDRMLAVRPDVVSVAKLTRSQFRTLIQKNSHRFDSGHNGRDGIESTEEYRLIVEFLNMTCCGDV